MSANESLQEQIKNLEAELDRKESAAALFTRRGEWIMLAQVRRDIAIDEAQLTRLVKRWNEQTKGGAA